jgi:hypothetical protein
MSRRLGLSVLLLLVPALACAQPPARGRAAEAMLAENTVLYVRFDGLEPHRKAYDQTAFAELMRGDTGRLLDYLGRYLTETLAQQLKDLPPGGDIPPQLLKLQGALAYLPQLGEYFKQHGFVMGVELLDIEMPRTQMTLVLPNAGERKHKDAFFAVIQMIANAAEFKIKENKQGARTLYELEGTDPVRVAWWVEGNDLVISAGTEKPDHVIGLIDGKGNNLTANALFKNVAGFDRYETAMRGFIDLEKVIAMVKAKIPPAAAIIQELGLDGLKSVTIHSGFEGKYDRSTIALNLGSERKGLLRLMKAAGSVDVAQLPPIAPDATGVTAMEFDCAAFYDVALQTLESVMKLVAPDELPKLQEGLKTVNEALGVNLRDDLLGSLGSSALMYNSPSEGIFSLGNAYLVKVKDKKKLQSTLEKICKAGSQHAGVDIAFKQHKFHDAELYVLNVAQPGFIFAPTYTIYKDWMVVGLYPQVVQGFLLRTSGQYPVWKPSATLEKALADAKKTPGAKITSVSESDPRPTVKLLLSLAPLGAGALNSFVPGGFDVTMIPNAHAVCKPLFPNATLMLDDGNALRVETYASLSVPDLTPSLGMLGMMGVFGTYARAVGPGFAPPVPPQAVPIRRDP